MQFFCLLIPQYMYSVSLKSEEVKFHVTFFVGGMPPSWNTVLIHFHQIHTVVGVLCGSTAPCVHVCNKAYVYCRHTRISAALAIEK